MYNFQCECTNNMQYEYKLKFILHLHYLHYLQIVDCRFLIPCAVHKHGRPSRKSYGQLFCRVPWTTFNRLPWSTRPAHLCRLSVRVQCTILIEFFLETYRIHLTISCETILHLNLLYLPTGKQCRYLDDHIDRCNRPISSNDEYNSYIIVTEY